MLIRQLYAGNMPQLVMFDLDGTLVDSVPDVAIAVDAMLAALKLPEAGASKVTDWIGNGVPVLVQRALADAGMKDDAGNMESPAFQEALGEFSEAYDQVCGRYSVVYDGVYETLNALADAEVKLAVITNKSERFTHGLLQHLMLDKYFSMVICGDSLKDAQGKAIKKPDPAALAHVVDHFGVEPSQSLMVGDSRHDIAAARALGVPCVAVPYGYNHGEPIVAFHPDQIVASLIQLVTTSSDL